MNKPVKKAGQENPNPQGKGLVPVLRDWGSLQPSEIGPKTPADFLRDYCISSLVLAAEFRFKPVQGKTYYLYATEQGWNLSMVAPGEWGKSKSAKCLAGCRLRPDMTWELDMSELEENAAVLEKARRFIHGFVDTLGQQDSIREHLPFYISGLPYYQRLLATALATSLQASLPDSGDDMQALLSDQAGLFLPAGRVP